MKLTQTRTKAEGGARACSSQYRMLLSAAATNIFRSPVIFSRSRLRVIEGAPSVLYTHVGTPARLRGARFGISKSRLAGSFRGADCHRARAKRFHRNPKLSVLFFFIFYCHCVAQLLILQHHSSSSPQRPGSHGTTAAALQHFRSVKATNGACMHVCARVSSYDPTAVGTSKNRGSISAFLHLHLFFFSLAMEYSHLTPPPTHTGQSQYVSDKAAATSAKTGMNHNRRPQTPYRAAESTAVSYLIPGASH